MRMCGEAERQRDSGIKVGIELLFDKPQRVLNLQARLGITMRREMQQVTTEELFHVCWCTTSDDRRALRAQSLPPRRRMCKNREV
jgi:hypothetical protein